MSTFSVVQGAGNHNSNGTGVSATLSTNLTEGNLLVVQLGARTGTPVLASTLEVSDGNSGSWTYVTTVVDNEPNDSNARISTRYAYRLVTATDAGGTLQVTLTSTTGNASIGIEVIEISIPSGYTPSLLGESGAGSGTGPIHEVPTSTGSLTGSDLLHVFMVGTRHGSALETIGVSEYTITTEYERYQYLGANNSMGGMVGCAIDGQAGGVFTVTADITASTITVRNQAEGTIAQIVFENAGPANTSVDLAAGSYSLSGQVLSVATGQPIALNAGSYALTGQALGIQTDQSYLLNAGSYSLSGQVLTIGGRANESDDFSSGVLDTGLWAITNTPSGTSRSFGNDGTDYWLELATTDGTDHDNYASLAPVPYIAQESADEDMDIRVRVLTQGDVQYEGHGLLFFGATAGEYIRFDFNYGNAFPNGFAYAAYNSGASTTVKLTQLDLPAGGWPEWMRVTRVGDYWRFYYSANGTDWTQIRNGFTQAMTLTAIGLDATSSYDSTGYAAHFDYFEDYLNDPISNEDDVGTSVDLAAGSYALSGQVLGVSLDTAVDLAAGSYALSGQVLGVSTAANTNVDLVAGSYTVSGQPLGVDLARELLLTAGSYALSGQPLGVTLDVIVDLAAGSYALSGQELTAETGATVSLDAGSYSLSGQQLGVEIAAAIALGAGSYTLSGQPVDLNADRPVSLSSGSYSLSGQALGTSFERSVALAAGSYALSGQSLGITVETQVALDAGSYSLSGQVLGVTLDSIVSLAAGSYSLSGQILGVFVDRPVSLASGAYALSLYDLTVNEEGQTAVDLDPGAYSLSGQVLGVDIARTLDLAAGSYALSGQPLGVEVVTPVALVSGSYALSGYPLGIVFDIAAALDAGNYTLTGPSLGVSLSGESSRRWRRTDESYEFGAVSPDNATLREFGVVSAQDGRLQEFGTVGPDDIYSLIFGIVREYRD